MATDYKQISELTEAQSIANTDLFVIQQGSTAKKCTGLTFLAMVQAHGGITSITKTGTSGNVDTYTITYSDATTTTFTVTNGIDGVDGVGITSITKTSTEGIVDTYTITYTDSTTTTFTVTNGEKGDTGDDASVSATDYVSDNQGTTPPTSGWQSIIPTVLAGYFLWTRFTWNNGEYSYICTKYGINGTGTGDMEKSVYDANDVIATSGGIQTFVNSSIATNTANYISNQGQPFTSVEQLEAYTGTVTNNDYAFVTGTDAEGNTYFDRYKATVSGSTVTWAMEYRLNNSSFTSAQWATINSGISASDKTTWNGKADKPDMATTSLSSVWTGSSSPYSQEIIVSGATITNNSKVDIQPNSTMIAQLINDGCNALYIENNNGTLTAYAIGEKPSVAINDIQVTVTEVV